MAEHLAEHADPPGVIRRDLARFATALRAHLLLEARTVYPVLLHHADPVIRDLAADYQAGMSRLLDHFNAYNAVWSAAGAIEADRVRFARETESLAAAVRRRIALENDNLYTAVERGSGIVA